MNDPSQDPLGRLQATVAHLHPDAEDLIPSLPPDPNDVRWAVKEIERLRGKVAQDTGNIEPIQVWPFHNSPAKLREIVEDDDDCDWLALLPPEYEEMGSMGIPWWLQCTHFGRCNVDEYRDDRGWIVLVGRHA